MKLTHRHTHKAHTERQMKSQEDERMDAAKSNFLIVWKTKFVSRFDCWGWRGQSCIAQDEEGIEHTECAFGVRLLPAHETRLSNIFYFMFWLHCNGFRRWRSFSPKCRARACVLPNKWQHTTTHMNIEHMYDVVQSQWHSCWSTMWNVQVCVEHGNKTVLLLLLLSLLLRSRHNIFSIFLVPSPSHHHGKLAAYVCSPFYFAVSLSFCWSFRSFILSWHLHLNAAHSMNCACNSRMAPYLMLMWATEWVCTQRKTQILRVFLQKTNEVTMCVLRMSARRLQAIYFAEKRMQRDRLLRVVVVHRGGVLRTYVKFVRTHKMYSGVQLAMNWEA